jgi:hypothetical protein
VIIEIRDQDSSIELDQVPKDQPTPAISPRLHKQPTFRKAAEFDRRETEIFRKRTNLLCSTVIVARQEYDSPAPMYGRILLQDGSDQMVEALDLAGAPVVPALDPVRMIEPPLPISRSAFWTVKIVPFTLVSKVSSMCSAVISPSRSWLPGCAPPA